jgi:hypothetical protein
MLSEFRNAVLFYIPAEAGKGGDRFTTDRLNG